MPDISSAYMRNGKKLTIEYVVARFGKYDIHQAVAITNGFKYLVVTVEEGLPTINDILESLQWEKEMLPKDAVIIYCDGAFSLQAHIGIGGWAWVAIQDDIMIAADSGVEVKHATSQRMELRAGIKAMQWCVTNQLKNCYLVTDSQYLASGINSWLYAWKRNRWHKSSGKSIENIDLWKLIDVLVKQLDNITVEHTKGHQCAGVHAKWNNIVDKMAVEARTNHGNKRLCKLSQDSTMEGQLQTKSEAGDDYPSSDAKNA